MSTNWVNLGRVEWFPESARAASSDVVTAYPGGVLTLQPVGERRPPTPTHRDARRGFCQRGCQDPATPATRLSLLGSICRAANVVDDKEDLAIRGNGHDRQRTLYAFIYYFVECSHERRNSLRN